MSHKLILSPSDSRQVLDFSAASIHQQDATGETERLEAGSIIPGQGSGQTEIVWDWALCDALGQRLAHGHESGFNEILHIMTQNSISDLDVVGLVPANMIFRCNINIPSKAQRVIQQALPFAVEELVAQDVESLHIAKGEREKNDIPVIALDKPIFSSLLNQWQVNGYSVIGSYADSQLLPLGDNDIVCYIFGADCWVHTKSSAIKLNSSVLPFYIDSWVNEEGLNDQNVNAMVYVNVDYTPDHQLIIASLQQNGAIVINQEVTQLTPIEFFAEGYFHSSNTTINLCQGEFQVTKQQSESWKRWMGVAAVLCVWFLAEIGFNIGKGAYYEAKADAALSAAVAEYKTVFPTDRRVSEANVTRFLKSKLQLAGQGNKDVSFLNVLGVTGTQYYRVQNNQKLKMNSLNFNAQRGELTLEIEADSLDQLDQLKRGIGGEGFTTKIGSAVKEKDHIRGRISIQGGQS